MNHIQLQQIRGRLAEDAGEAGHGASDIAVDKLLDVCPRFGDQVYDDEMGMTPFGSQLMDHLGTSERAPSRKSATDATAITCEGPAGGLAASRSVAGPR